MTLSVKPCITRARALVCVKTCSKKLLHLLQVSFFVEIPGKSPVADFLALLLHFAFALVNRGFDVAVLVADILGRKAVWTRVCG